MMPGIDFARLLLRRPWSPVVGSGVAFDRLLMQEVLPHQVGEFGPSCDHELWVRVGLTAPMVAFSKHWTVGLTARRRTRGGVVEWAAIRDADAAYRKMLRRHGHSLLTGRERAVGLGSLLKRRVALIARETSRLEMRSALLGLRP